MSTLAEPVWLRPGLSMHTAPIPAIDALARLGLAADEPGLRTGVGLALIHSSYLHENRDSYREVSAGLLEALSRLGGAFLARLAAADAVVQAGWSEPGPLSEEIARLVSALPRWSLTQGWLAEAAFVGRSLAGTPLPPKTTAEICRQVLGVLCIAGHDEVASRWLADLFATVRASGDVADPVELLRRVTNSGPISYESQPDGPDHATVFRTVVTDERGHSGVGEGQSLKQAKKQAALNFLEQHYPQVLRTSTVVPSPRKPPVEVGASTDHASTVRRVQTLFALPPTAQPLLSQALIHASWAYEHKREIDRYHQQSNQVLARVGSTVLDYEHNLAVAQQAAIQPPPRLALLTLQNETFNEAFGSSGLESGLLMGSGQSRTGAVEDIGAAAFQAMIGAVYISKGLPRSLAADWPTEWSRVWSIIAPDRPREMDDTSRVERAASKLHLRVSYDEHDFGPDNEKSFEATISLTSVILGETLRIGAAPSTTKAGAKHQASHVIVDVLERVADDRPAHVSSEAGKFERLLAQFVLRHQAANRKPDRLTTSTETHQRPPDQIAVSARHGPAIDDVPLEAHISTTYEISASGARTQGERREAALVHRYVAWVEQRGARCRSRKIPNPDTGGSLFCDLYNELSEELIEAKGSASRENVRMALGQLLDYGRNVPHRRLGVLLPTLPAEDLVALLAQYHISCIYEESEGVFQRIDTGPASSATSVPNADVSRSD